MTNNCISIQTGSTFSFSECIWFLDRNYDDCLHVISENKILKPLLIFEKPFLLGISQKEDILEVEILSGTLTSQVSTFIRNYIQNWFDLDRDLSSFYELLSRHRQLSYMTTEFNGLRMTGIPDLFEALCWGVMGQQINLTFAYKLKRRLVEKYGSRIDIKNDTLYIFPSCQVLAQAQTDDLKAMQFSSKKSEYIIGIAKIFAEGKISKEILSRLPDFEARQKMLMSVRGIGIWTANYALMKSLKEQSGIPHGDAGLLQALLAHDIITDKKDNSQIQAFFDQMSGWESYTVFYLWRSLAKKLPQL